MGDKRHVTTEKNVQNTTEKAAPKKDTAEIMEEIRGKWTNISEAAKILAKTTVKDSVFTNLFGIRKYTFQFYKTIHPEDEETTEEDIEIMTLENILLNQRYNDLGFAAKKKLVLVISEAQVKWTANIVPRELIYIAQELHQYIRMTGQNVYDSKKIILPKMEFYVIFIGSRKTRPEYMKLSEEFFGGEETALELKVKMLYGTGGKDIISQYVDFTKVYNEQFHKYGRTQKAVLETIQICKKKDILREYLEEREKEVVDIMMTLYDKEMIMEDYLRAVAKEHREEGERLGREEGERLGREKGLMAAARNLLAMGFAPEQIAEAVEVKLDTVNKWLFGDVTPAK